MSAHDFETHRCDGSLEASCSIRRNPHKKLSPFRDAWMRADGEWHLYVQEWNSEWDVTYMSHVAKINHCPWCGKELPDV